MELQNKVAIITGGCSGLGLAITKKFLEEGAKVVVGDYNPNGKSVLKELGYDENCLKFCETNVAIEEEVKNLVNYTVESFGKLDIAVANAGISAPGDITEIDYDTWKKVLSIDLDGIFLVDKYAIEQMIKQNAGGSIINTSSVGGLIGFNDGVAYSSAKSGVVNLTKSLVVGFADKGIRVNSIAPGFIDTPLISTLPQALQDSMVSKHPIGRLAQPEEIANAFVFLASDKSSFITGITLPVDGGYTAI